jgi:hypothetical protein
MKLLGRFLIIGFVTLTAVFSANAAPLQPEKETVRRPHIDETEQFIFYSVLLGLYEDGLSNEDVAQILMKKEGQTYFHFILACPICSATIWALEAYQSRPKQFYGRKAPGSTVGPGLSEAQHQQLYSDKPYDRLDVINALVRSWISRRMQQLRLTDDERSKLLGELEKKRKEGMEMLESFRKKQHGPNFGVEQGAPAYVQLRECAVCNAAVSKPMALPSEPAKEK